MSNCISVLFRKGKHHGLALLCMLLAAAFAATGALAAEPIEAEGRREVNGGHDGAVVAVGVERGAHGARLGTGGGRHAITPG